MNKNSNSLIVASNVIAHNITYSTKLSELIIDTSKRHSEEEINIE